ncbi:MAG: hypothetical protein LC795_18700 [Acidobacteria bacterium]|nr:hypothetical protein [Acidobacteriota bacterium]
MSQQQTRDNSETRLRTTRLIWVAMMASVGVSFLLGFMFLREPDPHNIEQTEVNVFLGPLLVMSLASAYLSFTVKKYVLAKSDGRQPSTAQTAAIVGFALAEAGALLGLVAILVTGNLFSFLIMAVGAAALLFHYPRA